MEFSDFTRAKALPYVTSAASKALPALATGAVSALSSLGVDKIFGKGVRAGGFFIPQNKIDQLIKHKNWLTEAQKKQILSAVHTGGQLVIRPTKTQRGGFLGSLLASIGIPLALELGSKLFGKGLTVPKKAGTGLMVGPKPGMVPYHPPPFYGSWEGVVKKKRPRNSIGPKQSIQQYTSRGNNSVKWVDYLKIPNFKGIFSRDSEDHVHKTGCCIINLDDKIGNRTHWVATFVKPKTKIIYYFDSFSLPPPMEFLDYAKRLKMRYKFNSGYPIQDINSVRCGYYSLFFLDNAFPGLRNPQFNENFIKYYFS